MEITRKRLLDRVCKEQLTLIQAPTGFGKSTLIRQFLSKYKNVTSIHLPIHSFDEHHYQFLLKLFDTLERELGGNYFRLTRSILKTKEFDYDVIKQKFVKELAEFEKSILFIFDGIESLSYESFEFLSHMIRYSHKDIYYVVTSRRRIRDLRIPTRMIYETINSDDLSFTMNEIGELFSNDIDEETVKIIWQDLKGWPFGVSLLYKLWNEGIELKDIIMRVESKYEDVLYERVFNRQSSEMKEFLIKTNLLDSFDRSLAEFTYGEDGGKLLDKALEEQLFIYGDEEYGYKYHTIFNKLLERLSKERLSSDEIANLLVDAGRFYLEKGDTFNALIYTIKSGVEQEINDVVECSLDDISIYSYQQLENILDYSVEEKYLGVLFIRASYYLRVVKLLKAKNLFKLCLKKAINQYKMIYSLSFYHLILILERINVGDSDIKKLFDDIPKDCLKNKYILNIFAFRYYIKKEFEQSLTYQRKAIEYSDEDKSPNWTAKMFCNLSLILIKKGDYTSALDISHRTLEMIKEDNYVRAQTLGYLININLNINNINKAKKYLEGLCKLEKHLRLGRLKLLLIYRGYISLELNQLENAMRDFSRMVEITVKLHGKNFGDKSDRFILNSGLYPLCLTKVLMNEGDSIPSLLNEYNINDDPLELLKTDNLCWIGLTIHYVLKSKLSEKTLIEMRRIGEGKGGDVEILLDFISSIYYAESGEIREISEDEIEEERFIPRIVKRFFYNYTKGKGRYKSKGVPTVIVKMLGGLRIEIDGEVITEKDWGYKRAMALLSYIIKQRDEEFTGERLIGNIWSDVDYEKGRSRLKTALRHIRAEFERFKIEDVIEYSGGVYYLNRDIKWWVDVEELESSIEYAQSYRKQDNLEDAFSYYRIADNLTRGDFLPNIYDDWASSYYNYYQIIRLEVLEQLCRLSVELKDRESFLKYSRNLILHSDEDEYIINDILEQAEKLDVTVPNLK